MRSKKYLQKLPVKLILLVILFLVLAFVFGLIAHEVLNEKEDQVDRGMIDFITKNIESDWLTNIMRTVTFFGSILFLFIAYAVLLIGILLSRKNNLFALDIAAIAIGCFIFTNLLKILFHRIRPLNPLTEHLKNYSFPSGHAASGFIFYVVLAYMVWRSGMRSSYRYLFSCLLILFSLLIGFSRIYLQIHYFSDVIAGFCLGIAWLSISIWFLEKIRSADQ